MATAGLVLSGCGSDDDTDAADVAADISVELSPEAEEALDDVLASVPDLAEGEPSDDVDVTLPSADRIERLGECFGIDFDELEDALDEDMDLGTVPGGSVPFDVSIFEDFENLTPEELQRLFEEELEELRGALSSVPDMTVPPMSMPEFSVPSLPFDADELEDCLNDAAES